MSEDGLRLLLRLAASGRTDARVREQLRATVLLVLLAQLLAGGGVKRPERGRFGRPAPGAVPRRRRLASARGSLAGRRPRG